jgi:Na+-translocating ferredoxin:NAD+ oxidoreductase RnfE subunit
LFWEAAWLMAIMLVLVMTNLLASNVTATVSYPNHLLVCLMVLKISQVVESSQILYGPYSL